MHSDSTYDFLVRNQLPEILESHQQLALLNRRFQGIHFPQRGPADAGSVSGERSAVARANKLLLSLVPRNRATQVRTDRGENPELALIVLRYIDCLLRYRLPPAIDLFDLNCAHDRLSQRRKLAEFSHWRTIRLRGPA